jgi:hypothetical protein
MNLKDLAAKPTLIKMTIDDEDIVKEYGEPLEFYSWDRQPIESFLKVAQSGAKDSSVLFDAVKNMVLDADGKNIISEGMTLPSPVLLKVINKIVETLGK